MDNTLFFALFLQRLTEASLFRLRWCQSEPSPQSFSPLLYKLKVVRLVWVVAVVVVLVNTQEAQQANSEQRKQKESWELSCKFNLQQQQFVVLL